jgi:hypothetical protein
MPSRYGPKGFTQEKDVRALLGAHERKRGSRGGRIRLHGLPARRAAELLEHLPVGQRDDQASEAAPTFADLVDLTLSLEGATLSGYRVDPDDLGERVTLSGVTVPYSSVNHETMQALADAAGEIARLEVHRDGSVSVTWTED